MRIRILPNPGPLKPQNPDPQQLEKVDDGQRENFKEAENKTKEGDYRDSREKIKKKKGRVKKEDKKQVSIN
jgi:hypothetical protein